ncbi:MAG: hypothetical protein R3240_06665 [Gammaproteobacteria bacterium]|nr:hypothetical protein [Gammaproteobacteria bacterium]
MSENQLELKQGNGFALQPQNLNEAMKLAEMISQSSIVPKDFKGKSGDTLVAMMMGSELGLNPLQALQNIAVINGRPAIWGDAMLALVQNNPNFAGIKETFDESTMTAICIVTRKGGEPHTERFSQKDAETAGLWSKPGPWKQYPKRMLALRARGYALRNQFADALSGLTTVEEARDINVVDITDTATVESVTRTEAQVLLAYPEEKFDENFPKWKAVIEAGRKSAADVIKTVEAKYTLTDDQKSKLNKIEVIS